MPAQTDISVPGACAGEVAYAFTHGSRISSVISLIANSQAGDYQSTNAAIAPFYFTHRCELGRWKRGDISPLDGVAASGTIGVNAPTS